MPRPSESCGTKGKGDSCGFLASFSFYLLHDSVCWSYWFIVTPFPMTVNEYGACQRFSLPPLSSCFQEARFPENMHFPADLHVYFRAVTLPHCQSGHLSFHSLKILTYLFIYAFSCSSWRLAPGGFYLLKWRNKPETILVTLLSCSKTSLQSEQALILNLTSF